MMNQIRELSYIELGQIAGGAPIPLGGSPEMGIAGGGGRLPTDPSLGGDNPFGGVGGGDPKMPIVGGGRDWWILPGLPGDPTPVLPILKPDPGKP